MTICPRLGKFIKINKKNYDNKFNSFNKNTIPLSLYLPICYVIILSNLLNLSN